MVAFCKLLVELGVVEELHLYFLFENHAKGSLLSSFTLPTNERKRLFFLAACDGDFGAQYGKLKNKDLICVDQVALLIDTIKNQV